MLYKIKRFFYQLGNFWRFRKEIFNFQPWDYHYNIELFIKSLELTADYIEEKDRHTTAKEDAEDIRFFCYWIKNYDNMEVVHPEYYKYLMQSEFNFKEIKEGELKGMYELEIDRKDYTEEEATKLLEEYQEKEKMYYEATMSLLKDKLLGWWD